jgi:beta-glucosidase
MSANARRRSFAIASLLAFASGACTHPELPAPTGFSGSGNVASNPNQPGVGGSGNGGSAGNGDQAPPVFNGDTTPDEVDVCRAATYEDPFAPGQNVPPPPTDAQVTAVLNLMAPAERIKQLQGVDANLQDPGRYNDVQRSQDAVQLDGRQLRGYFYRDAGRGVNLDARQEQRPFVNNYSTAFPVASARGASFDLDLEYRIGEAIGDETVASQNTMLLAPCMNILRHPYWGRAQETYGEDVFLLGRMASALTAGLQTNVAACAKHFAANNVENGRDNNNADMDEQTLREIYSRHFEMVIEEGGVACIMAAYNSVNDVKSTQNRHLLTDILRSDFGFQGLVISDWWAMPGAQSAPSTQTAQSNATQALRAGLDIEVPWTLNYGQLDELLSRGDISQEEINTAAGRVLKQKMRFKALYRNEPIGLKTPLTTMVDGSITNNDAHVALAREAALKSMVLLKNANNILPINKQTIRSIGVLGARRPYVVQSVDPQPNTRAPSEIDFAVDVLVGDRGSSRVQPDPAKSVGPFAGIQQVASAAGITVTTSDQAAQVAGADLIVVVVGLTPGDEGEEYAIPAGGDRSTLTLPSNQDGLVQAAIATGKPVVVVIETGGIINMPWLQQAAAVVMAWYPGQQGGLALGQLLFNEAGANFSGKLPVSWPLEADLPAFKSSGVSTEMSYFLGYRRLDQEGKTPIFPFGHGLSYSSFSYSNLQLGCPQADKDGVIPVSVTVTNESAVPGEETVFAFVRFPNTTARRSKKELKGFKKVPVAANSSVVVTIPLRVRDLKYWEGGEDGDWVIESGPERGVVEIMVGKSAADADLTLKDTVTIL